MPDHAQINRFPSLWRNRNIRLTITAAMVAGLAAASLSWWGGGGANAVADEIDASAVAPKLVIDGNFPDPEVNKFGDTYYAYSTNSNKNLPMATAKKPDGPWTVSGTDALPTLGKWAQPGRTWAPEVSKAANGNYLLYYTAHSINPDRQCIGVATAKSPKGPFAPVGDKPLVCPDAAGGAIDASTFVDGDKRYLIYKTDGNAIGQPPVVYLQQTSANGQVLQGDPVEILRNDRAEERGILEAPSLVKQGSHFVLFYAGGEYWNDSYYTSYAISSSLTGGYEKAYRPLMTGASLDGTVNGPGGADILRGGDSGPDKIFFHGHKGDGRAVYSADLGWSGDHPIVRGSRVRYEAENGKLTDCKVRDNAANASQGKVAAYIDNKTSSVELNVFAASAGEHTVAIGYANGSTEAASHAMSVNGGSAVTVKYPLTGWDNWKQVDVNVDLKAGTNTIRLTHATDFAEVDYVEVR